MIGQTIVNALITSSFYALVAVGLTLVFGVMKIVNFAHGEFYMLGAYAIYVLYARNSWPYFAALVVGIVLVGILGAVTERIIFRPLRGQLIPRLHRIDRARVHPAGRRGADVGRRQDEADHGSLQR